MKALRRTLVALLVLLTAFLGAMPAPSYAGPVPSGTGSAPQSRAQDIRHIESMLDDPTVLEGLRRAGTSPEQIRLLLPRMTDHDIHLLAERMDEVKTGGIGIIEILVIVLLVILIIYLVR